MCTNCECLLFKAKGLKFPFHPDVTQGTLHLEIACNPQWSFCVRGKLDLTC